MDSVARLGGATPARRVDWRFTTDDAGLKLKLSTRSSR
jgi:hypothetical protein